MPLTEEGRKRLSNAMKRRWKEKKKEEGFQVVRATKKPTKKNAEDADYDRHIRQLVAVLNYFDIDFILREAIRVHELSSVTYQRSQEVVLRASDPVE